MLNREEATALLSESNAKKNKSYAVLTFGCQQNEHDSEIISGVLEECGFLPSDINDADVIIFNTCAVRETAEEKVIGKIGALKALKYKKKDLVIGIGGCMTAIEKTADYIFKTFPFVSFVFGTNAISSLPELVLKATNGKRTKGVEGDAVISEELPAIRRESYRADISVMYGCNNFCSYCIVPYTRGREKSREPEMIIAEVKKAVEGGAKEIMLLGQNVNSYGKGLETEITFAKLLDKIASLPGDFRIRFMTSHPKDATDELLLVMARHEKICKHLHLPVQCGSDRVLCDMNRRYDVSKYLSIIKRARELMPDLTVTSDIIVGFPTETKEDFEGTLSLCREVEYDSLFTFIYSRRSGTKAAEMTPVSTDEEIHSRFNSLLSLQNEISKKKNDMRVGKTLKVLVTGVSENNPEMLAARTEGNRIVHFRGDAALTGSFAYVKITDAKTWSLFGEQTK